MSVLYYTVYRRGTDEIVAYGTAQECARIMGASLNTFYSIVSKNRKGIRSTYDILTERLEDIEGEEDGDQ